MLLFPSSSSLARSVGFGALCVCAFAFPVACKRQVEERRTVHAPASVGVLDAKAADDLRGFAYEFAEDVSSKNFAGIAEKFDYSRLLDRAFDGVTMEVNALADFREGALKGMGGAEGGVLRAAVGQSYQFLRVVEADGESQLLFRFISADGKLDYQRFRLVRTEDGTVRLYDFFGFIGGEYASESLRRMAWPVVMQSGGTVEDAGGESDAAEVAGLTALGGQMGNQEFEAALATLRALPVEVRAQRFLRSSEVQVLGAIPARRAEYRAALERLAEDFSSDPTIALTLVNGASSNGDFEGMRSQLERLANAVGSDAYHDVMAAASYAGEKDFARALTLAGRAVASEPDLREAWLFIVKTGLEAREFGAVASALVRLKDEFGYGFRRDQFEGIPDYQDFVGSNEGKAFLGMLEG